MRTRNMKQKILTASANTGIGLWTSICMFFCKITGTESFNYKMKQEKVLDTANIGLSSQLKYLGKDYYLVDYRVTWSGPLSVTVSALAVSNNEENIVKETKQEPKANPAPKVQPKEQPKVVTVPAKPEGWFCKCGAYNRITAMYCEACFSAKPKK